MDTDSRVAVVEDFGGLCAIKGCDLPELAAGFCNKHWRRLRKYGSPLWLTKPAASYRGMPVIDRFLTRVKKTDGCWLWTGCVDKDGYGIFSGEAAGVQYKKAHRFSWAYFNNKPVDRDRELCHSCDNPRCVNPEHLSLGTSLDNQTQKWRRGRGVAMRGSNHWIAKINEKDVRAIRASDEPQDVLAKRYGLTQSTISNIRRRKSWRHVT